MTGTPAGASGGTSPERRSSTARMPAASAPAMSAFTESPTISDDEASAPARSSASSKMLGCGFR